MHNADALVRQIVTLVRRNGFLAPDHAVSIAGNILDAKPLPEPFALLATALIRHAAIFDPFDREKLRLAEDVNSRIAHPPFTLWLDTAQQLTRSDPIPEHLPAPDQDDAHALLAYMKAQPSNSHRLPVLMRLWQMGDKDALIQAIQVLSGSPSGLLAGPLMAWGAYGAGEPELAHMLLDEGVENFLAHGLRAKMARQTGNAEAARAHCVAALEWEPFQPAMAEQLADHGVLIEPGRDTRICLYTWNKPDLLAGTMASLGQSHLGGAQVTVLNNGTTDCSPEALEQRIARAAPGVPVHWLHLPVNIGAPAARNWLLALPEVQAARYVAFLDDDVLVPRSWLSRYLGTLARTNAAAVGPKCVNQSVRTIQYAYRYFEEVGEHKIRFTANAPALMDMGQFDTVRPSLTVMGCCHLLDRGQLDRLGVPGFDIRFSPSQVDDIEHDLQIWKAGGRVAYDGCVEVVHLQDTGRVQTPQSIAQAYGNHHKMEHKFSLAQLERMDAASRQADTADFAEVLTTALAHMPPVPGDFWRILKDALREPGV